MKGTFGIRGSCGRDPACLHQDTDKLMSRVNVRTGGGGSDHHYGSNCSDHLCLKLKMFLLSTIFSYWSTAQCELLVGWWRVCMALYDSWVSTLTAVLPWCSKFCLTGFPASYMNKLLLPVNILAKKSIAGVNASKIHELQDHWLQFTAQKMLCFLKGGQTFSIARSSFWTLDLMARPATIHCAQMLSEEHLRETIFC